MARTVASAEPRRIVWPWIAALVAAGAGSGWFLYSHAEPDGTHAQQPIPPSAPEPAVIAETKSSTEPSPPPLPIEGRWKSRHGRLFDAVWNGEAFEFRVRDPAQFGDQHYNKGEVRFVVRPRGSTLLVVDRLRARNARFDPERARPSCVIELTEVDGAPLEATLDRDVLHVTLVKMTQTPPLFLTEGGKVIGCTGLEGAAIAPVESTLVKQ